VKLRHTGATLDSNLDLSGKTLARSRETIREARTAVEMIRANVNKRSRRPHDPDLSPDDDRQAPPTSVAPTAPVTVFLDADTVLLATHQGRYGPELGLQADLSDAIGRLFEIADRVVAVVDPPSADGAHSLDTQHRLDALRAGIGPGGEKLVVATCDHDSTESCDCAKPGHGLIEAHLDSRHKAENGWYVGGDQEGMVAGRSAGLRTIRIGPHSEDHLSIVHRPDYEARDLMDAANHIMVEALSPA
jgi:hypothetical protein